MKHLSLFIIFLLLSCGPPRQQLFQAKTATTVNVKNDSVYFVLNNPLKSPMRYYITSSNNAINSGLAGLQPVILSPQKDSLVKFKADSAAVKSIRLNTGLGDPKRAITPELFSLPFPKGNTYTVIQAYGGSYSHTGTYNKYAIDFSLKKGDAVCAAADGVVVGVIQGYRRGGSDKKWGDYANYITLYHPQCGLYTQYVHLKHNGSLVQVGDAVARGQVIGRSGKTGWTDVAHLHFNVLRPVDGGLASVPAAFAEGYKGEDLKKGDTVKN